MWVNGDRKSLRNTRNNWFAYSGEINFPSELPSWEDNLILRQQWHDPQWTAIVWSLAVTLRPNSPGRAEKSLEEWREAFITSKSIIYVTWHFSYFLFLYPFIWHCGWDFWASSFSYIFSQPYLFCSGFSPEFLCQQPNFKFPRSLVNFSCTLHSYFIYHLFLSIFCHF